MGDMTPITKHEVAAARGMSYLESALGVAFLDDANDRVDYQDDENHYMSTTRGKQELLASKFG